jgi:hypothetical protein
MRAANQAEFLKADNKADIMRKSSSCASATRGWVHLNSVTHEKQELPDSCVTNRQMRSIRYKPNDPSIVYVYVSFSFSTVGHSDVSEPTAKEGASKNVPSFRKLSRPRFPIKGFVRKQAARRYEAYHKIYDVEGKCSWAPVGVSSPT